MAVINFPVNWEPRGYQLPAWNYLTNGGKHAELIWHRRAGKDEICMYFTACEMLENPANYWHMLPQGNQVRKAIWEATNPRTGKRRIDEVFIDELFTKRETDMFIKCKVNASTWQCLGSDNYEGSIGSSPKGIVYSEWPQANPSARGYLRPIIAENDGWQIFIGTPRGKNHGYRTYNQAIKNPNSFAEKLTVYDTGRMTPQQLQEELVEYVTTYGEDMGIALFEQEYECSFDAAIMGAYYASECRKLEEDGRLAEFEWNHKYPVHAAMDIGRSDDTAIWFFQCYGGAIHVLETYATHGKDPDHFIGVIAGRDCSINIIDGKCIAEWGDANEYAHHRDWQYGSINMPHDARAKTFATLKSAEEQFAAAFGWDLIELVPGLSVEDGINAGRKALNIARIHAEDAADGYEAVKAYHRKWNDEKKAFSQGPDHDWSSHYADGWRYLAIVYSRDKLPSEAPPSKYAKDRTFNEIVANQTKRRLASESE